MKNIKLNILAIALFLSGFSLLNAQPGPPNPGGGNAPTPFGFVEILIGAGAVYGAKKAYDKKKSNEEA